ncbi:MAG: hypothetical protein AAF571_12855 [Verrucomicrobiota bacterium]
MITKDQMIPLIQDTFPDFEYDTEDLDTPYVILSDFSRYLLELYWSGDIDTLKRASEIIEGLHLEGDPYVREAATIGILEAIQNNWDHDGIGANKFYEYLLPESKRWWNSLNRFWQKEIPYVGADL